MRNILHSIVKNNILSNMLLILIFSMGIYSLGTLNRDMSQDLDFGVIQVTALYPGASTQEMEVKITNKVEDKLKDIEGITRYISIIYEGYSRVVIWLDLQRGDLEKVKDKIREKVNGITDFPKEMKTAPTIEEPSFSSMPFLKVGLYSEDKTFLRDFSLKLKDKIEDLNKIQEVISLGIPDEEFKILLDVNKLKRHSKHYN